VLEFLCPNGHHLRCDTGQLGRAARCPRCGVKFLVPDPAEDQAAEEVTGAEADAAGSSGSIVLKELTPPAAGESTGPDAGGSTPSGFTSGVDKETQFEFLCPKGHRLHGPIRLQGQPAQCPECRVKFRVPVHTELGSEEEPGKAEEDIVAGRVAGRADSRVNRRAVADSTISTAQQGHTSSDGSPTRPQQKHPLAVAFERLWAGKPVGGVVELQLRNGQCVVPKGLIRSLSQPTHLGCAVKESDGSYTLHVVAWDAVVQIVCRGLEELPENV